MKILLSAFSCWPTESSEPGVGWRFASQLSKKHEVWLLTDNSNGPLARINEYFKSSGNPGIHVCPFPLRPFPHNAIFKNINLYYAWWQRNIYLHALQLHEQNRFDIVHHVTLSRYWVGSSLAKLPIPFIWGPVGAGESVPTSFLNSLPPGIRIKCHLRELVKRLCEWDPLLKQTSRNCTVALTSTNETASRLKALGTKDIRRIPQICLTNSRLDYLASFSRTPPRRPFRLISAGRLLYWKGFQLAILTVAELIKCGLAITYEIVGDGPFCSDLRKLVLDLNLESSVKFENYLPNHEDVLNKIAGSHLLMHPALHEAFGNVCLEALAIGKPVVCLDIGGPASQITPSCGFAAPVETPTGAISAMAQFIRRISHSDHEYEALCHGARARANSAFDVAGQFAEIDSIYSETVSKSAIF